MKAPGVAHRDSMPLPTLAFASAPAVRVPLAAQIITRITGAISRAITRVKAGAECRHIEKTIENGENHVILLEASLAKTKLELADLRVQLALAEKRRDA